MEQRNVKIDRAFERCDFYAVIAECDKAIRKNPDDDYAYLCRGDANLYIGDYYGAFADYEEYIRIVPDGEDAVYQNRSTAVLGISRNG